MVLAHGLVALAVPNADIHKASLRRGCTSECPSSHSPWYVRARSSSAERPVSPGLLSSRKMMREKLWREFFSDPSQWWDHRSEKHNPRYPDFKHKKTQQSLWLNDKFIPAWVESELTAMAPGLLQSHLFSWHVQLRRHVKNGDYAKTLNLYQQMQGEGMTLDKFTFIPVLNACSNLKSLEEGKRIHGQVIKGGWESDVYVANCLVDMYAKCGSIEDAWGVFDKMRERTVVSWSAMIRGYVKSGQGRKAMELFRNMQLEGVEPDAITFVGVLNACASVAALEEGRRVHEQILERSFESDLYVANCLVDMYAKCGSIEDAWSVFDKMPQHDVVSWNAMIGGYVKSEQGLKAIELFQKMQQEEVEPNAVTFVGVLNACASVVALEEGRRVHEQIVRRGCGSDVYVATCLVDMYAKCGSIEDAWSVFNKMQGRSVVSWNAMIGGYVKYEEGLKAMELFRKMHQEGVEPNAITFVAVLNACASVGALEEGRRVHEHIIQRGWESDVYVANCLVDMYAKCGSMGDAWSVFDKMRERNVVSWSAIICGYVKSEQRLKAMELFRKMQQEGVEPNAVTFVGVLHACASEAGLDEGRCVHKKIIERGCESDVYVATCLVDMYSKCGSIEDAWDVFNNMPERNVVSWSAMIGGYVKSEQSQKAIELFRKMQQEGVDPDIVSFVGVLKACASVEALEEGRSVHEQVIQRGWESDVYVATCLVDMYAKCGSIGDAWIVFHKMWERDVVSWNAMIGGYVKCEQGLKAVELFWKMQQEGVEPNIITFLGVLNACASISALEEGARVHQQIIQRGCDSDVYVANCLIDMYAKCGSVENAWNVFDKMQERNVVSWSSMIGGYVKSEKGRKAMELFKKMQQEGVEPNAVTFVGALNACASLAALEEGKSLHEQIIRSGSESDVFVATSLVDMYAKCGSIGDAWSVFNKMQKRDVVSWSAMIVGYMKSEQGLKAIELYQKMQQEGVEPDIVTFVGVLNACASVAALEEGRHVHQQIIQRGWETDVSLANCLVDMYAKCGSIGNAWNVFDKMQERNVVSWSAMIGGYVKAEQGLKAIELFYEMLQDGMEPNNVTFVGVLHACASVATLEEGRRVHEQIIRGGCQTDVFVANSLVDMYSKCGSIEDAWNVFSQMCERDVVSWNAMIGGYAMHGHSKKAIGLLKRMGKEGIELNEITFTGLLSACSHGGLVKEGLHYFYSMTSCYDLLPTMEHYACIVDLLGRAGRLEEAEEITMTMPGKGDPAVWISLLGACRIHGNIEMAERAAKRCWVLDHGNNSGHVLLSNIYAAA